MRCKLYPLPIKWQLKYIQFIDQNIIFQFIKVEWAGFFHDKDGDTRRNTDVVFQNLFVSILTWSLILSIAVYLLWFLVSSQSCSTLDNSQQFSKSFNFSIGPYSVKHLMIDYRYNLNLRHFFVSPYRGSKLTGYYCIVE